ncbi:MAG: Ubiquinone biosynthesis O-methyltransferase [bacterium]|nr:Ubiquinone biosynthesis O-methyltransferase [bacterium]
MLNAQRIKWISALKPNGKLLDLGCGRGYFLATAREHGFEVTGIDVSARAIEYARRSFGVEATAKTLDELQKDSQKFDVITLWHVLEHFTDPVSTLRKIKNLLQENGVCCIEVPNLHSLKFMLSRSKWEGGNHPRYHRTFFTSTTLQQTLLKSGFTKMRRVKLDYDLPGRRLGYKTLKRISNLFALDAFLDYVAWK